ncbi:MULTISPECIES: SMI1/KNR4 family protein [Ensifer]|uniref:SMI1/KNR4 family protein n=1 Tax=Ensifer TaxID=106591 RepID=UPI0008075102|nr:SMI1/KNR4 family protein [Ensifer adhaerens]
MRVAGFQPKDDLLPDTVVVGAAMMLGVDFPPLYRELIRTHNGAYGDAEFPVAGSSQAGGFGLWLSLLPWDSESVWTSLACWSEHDLPRQIIPFGEDGGGNLVCFDYRSSSEPSIVLWYHELQGQDGIHPLAERFPDFLTLLRETVD